MNTYQYTFPEPKKRFIKQFSQIVATASYYPERVLTNQDIIDSRQMQVTDTAIRKTLGVGQRHVVDEGTTDSDLLAQAAQRCLQKAQIQPDQLSKIIVTKFLGDRILPMTASMVQRKLKCNVAMHAFDLEGGINAFLHALDLATRYISTSAEDNPHILILSGGIHQLVISKNDPRLAFLFGDGAAAVLLSKAQQSHFLASYFYSNPQYFEQAGSRMLKMDEWVSQKIYEEGRYDLLYNLYQMGNWKDSIDFFLDASEIIATHLLRESGLTMDEIDYVLVPEQNKKFAELILDRLQVPAQKSISIIRERANTMTAMLPGLLDHGFSEGLFKPGTRIMLISHGEGASGGGMIYRI